jgi:hypothetical protein
MHSIPTAPQLIEPSFQDEPCHPLFDSFEKIGLFPGRDLDFPSFTFLSGLPVFKND